MSKHNLLPEEQILKLNQQIQQVRQMYGDTAQAKQVMQALLRKSLLYSGLGLGGVGAYYGVKSVTQ